ncbi:MAG: hypothetical protein CL961_06105 [Euryarchaeota archaeon]|nr:hypothetical protein [Euryarchaeota archaeon]
MALTEKEVIQGMQIIADRGEENNLNERGRKVFDAAVRDGLIKPSRGFIGGIKETISPRFQEDLREVESIIGMPTNPVEAQNFIQNLDQYNTLRLGPFEKYRGAKIVEGRYGRPVVETLSGERRYLNSPGISLGDIPRFAEAGLQFVDEAVPYLAAPQAGFVKGALQTGAIGALSEGANVAERAIRGEDLQTSRLATTPLIAMAGDVFGRGAFSVIGNVYTKITGKRALGELVDSNTGQINPQKMREMRQKANTEEIEDQMFKEMVDKAESGELEPTILENLVVKMDDWIASGQASSAQVERYNLFKRLKLEPTKAQVTRSADDFTTQSELARNSGPTLTALETQQRQLMSGIEQAERATGGSARADIAPLQSAVVNKALILDDKINKLYKQAATGAGSAGTLVDISGYVNHLNSIRHLNKRSGGTYTALVGQLKNDFQLKLDADGPILVSADKAEVIRQMTNKLNDPKNGVTQNILRDSREQLDYDVGLSLGKDYYKEARDAYKEFRRGLDPDQLSKFSTNKKSLIRDLLEEKIPSERVFERVIASKSYTAADLRALKNYIVGRGDNINPAGASAWADLRAETLAYIRTNAFSDKAGETISGSMTRTSLNKVLDKIGPGKLKIIFTADELAFIKDLQNAMRAMEPPYGTGGGLGPTAPAVRRMEGLIRQFSGRIGNAVLDFGNSIVNAALTAGKERAATRSADTILSTARKLNPAIPQAGGVAGAVTGVTTTEDMR